MPLLLKNLSVSLPLQMHLCINGRHTLKNIKPQWASFDFADLLPEACGSGGSIASWRAMQAVAVSARANSGTYWQRTKDERLPKTHAPKTPPGRLKEADNN